MNHHDIDLNVTKESNAMLREISKFGMEVLRPAGMELDRLKEPEEVIADDSVLWEVFRKSREMDLHLLQMPKAFGGNGLARDYPDMDDIQHESPQRGYTNTPKKTVKPIYLPGASGFGTIRPDEKTAWPAGDASSSPFF